MINYDFFFLISLSPREIIFSFGCLFYNFALGYFLSTWGTNHKAFLHPTATPPVPYLSESSLTHGLTLSASLGILHILFCCFILVWMTRAPAVEIAQGRRLVFSPQLCRILSSRGRERYISTL